MKGLIEYAMRFLGVPYIWGGSNPMGGFDCSGYIQWILQSVGADPQGDQNAQGIHDLLLKSGGIPLKNPQAGAICFYGKTPSQITHVSFCISEHQIIEAGGGGANTTSALEAAKHDACVRVRPVNGRKDLVEIVLPKYPMWVNSGQ